MVRTLLWLLFFIFPSIQQYTLIRIYINSFLYVLGPDAWTGICASGERQSPIDLPSSYDYDAEPVDSIQFSDAYFDHNAEGMLINNGHSGKSV